MSAQWSCQQAKEKIQFQVAVCRGLGAVTTRGNKTMCLTTCKIEGYLLSPCFGHDDTLFEHVHQWHICIGRFVMCETVHRG